MKYKTRTNKIFDHNCSGINPSKVEDRLDEKLILKMDEEAPEHVFPEPNLISAAKGHEKS